MGQLATTLAGLPIVRTASGELAVKIVQVGGPGITPSVVTAVRTTDLTRINTITPIADPVLIISVTPGLWFVRLLMIFSSPVANPGYRIQLTQSGTFSFSAGYIEQTVGGLTSVRSSVPNPGAPNIFAATSTNNATTDFAYDVVFTLNVTGAGNLGVNWAQQILDAVNGTVLKTGSVLTATKIG